MLEFEVIEIENNENNQEIRGQIKEGCASRRDGCIAPPPPIRVGCDMVK